jgi:hypothetical protein
MTDLQDVLMRGCIKVIEHYRFLLERGARALQKADRA